MLSVSVCRAQSVLYQERSPWQHRSGGQLRSRQRPDLVGWYRRLTILLGAAAPSDPAWASLEASTLAIL